VFLGGAKNPYNNTPVGCPERGSVLLMQLKIANNNLQILNIPTRFRGYIHIISEEKGAIFTFV
jgi:hypothetical protein